MKGFDVNIICSIPDDINPPDVSCPGDVSKTVELGIPQVPINFTEPSATDMSGNVTLVSRNHNPGDEFPVGSTRVEYVFSDGSGNQASCNFNVVVNTIDTTPPNVKCIDDVNTTTELGTSELTITFSEPSATDLSGNVTLFSSSHLSGDEFPIGSTLLEYVFSDGSGNQESCEFSINIETYDFRDPLGLESGSIPDSSLTASSSLANPIRSCSPQRVRLFTVAEIRSDGTSFGGAWVSAVTSMNEWIQVDLLTLYRVRGVATQGRQEYGQQWVTSYKINCSRDNMVFDTVQDRSRYPSTDKIFHGNEDMNSVVKNAFPQPMVCRFIRLLPYAWNERIALRMELYGDLAPVTGENEHVMFMIL
ncbi:hyalin-like [Lytechinus variegatus]|uniref:hyalin-like n=1 Tax=Lytechinus variegatus TaxID=7654 RepID=UPI001BB151DB|nr:hyalin-like [Lytechinus variegatus]